MTPNPDAQTQEEICLQVLHRFQEIAQAHGDMRRAVGRFNDGGLATKQSSAYQGNNDATVGEKPAETSKMRDMRWLEARQNHSSTAWVKAPGLAASRTRWNEPMGLGGVIKRMIRSQGWDTETAMGAIMTRWPMIVGQAVAAHCKIETFDGHKLMVRCSSTAWAKQLTLLLPHIERRIDEEVGAGVVTQVIIRGPSAPSWRHGPISVPGRGPRDTYG